MAHREELAGCVTLPTGLATGAAMLLLDKRQQYRRLSELGVRLPRTWIPTDGDAVAAAAAEARYPVVVKPAFGDAWRERLGGAKLLVCHGPAADRDAAAAGEGTILQEVIPGPETELRVMAVHMGSDGRPGPWVTARKLRQYPADYGSGSRVMACSDPELEEHTLALLTRLAIPGTFGAEWKRYRGQLWLVEINPRPVLWIGLAPAVVQDAWRELSGRSRDAPGPAVAAGRVWQDLLRDLLASRAAPGRLGDVLCEAARDDPLPGLIGPAAAAWQWASRRFGSAAGAAPGRDVSGPRRSAG